jgi:hypothetical protein
MDTRGTVAGPRASSAGERRGREAGEKRGQGGEQGNTLDHKVSDLFSGLSEYYYGA